MYNNDFSETMDITLLFEIDPEDCHVVDNRFKGALTLAMQNERQMEDFVWLKKKM